jgi:hypothetical protein
MLWRDHHSWMPCVNLTLMSASFEWGGERDRSKFRVVLVVISAYDLGWID